MNCESIEEMMSFLQGKDVPNMKISHYATPNLSRDQAWSVIYALQEYFGIIPDTFEICNTCHVICDSECEGFWIDEAQTDAEGGDGMFKKEYAGTFQCDSCLRMVEIKEDVER